MSTEKPEEKVSPYFAGPDGGIWTPNGPVEGVVECRKAMDYLTGRELEARKVPSLVEALEGLMEFWDEGTPVHPGAEVVSAARAALERAKKGVQE